MARLISPEGNRIYPNAMTGAKMETAGSITKAQREGFAVGQADPMTWRALEQLGWKAYDGPLQTDERGYIIREKEGA